MVYGILIYRFDLRLNDKGDIDPEFQELFSHPASDLSDPKQLSVLITENDLFGLLFNHTSGSTERTAKGFSDSFLMGKFKERPYHYISHYYDHPDNLKFMTVAVFKPESEVEPFEQIFYQTVKDLQEHFMKITNETLNNIQLMQQIEEQIHNRLEYGVFQIERLSNLTKTQKFGLIFSSADRIEALKILREGPIIREKFIERMKVINKNINMESLIKPFIELNVVRREWIKGKKDRSTKGEYLFLLKDIALVRTPPDLEYMQEKQFLKTQDSYYDTMKNFYKNYNPFEKSNEDSKNLAHFLLDPDIYDFLTLIGEKIYPVSKFPKITSKFSNMGDIVEILKDAKIIILTDDDQGNKWVTPIAKITPMVIFPEYLLPTIVGRTLLPKGSIKSSSLVSPITDEIAIMALNLLESNYNEKVTV